MPTTATLESRRLRVEAGAASAVTLNIRNDTTIVEEYHLEVVGPTSLWSEVEPPARTLLPGESSTIAVGFHPPRSSDVLAGDYDYGVHVLPTEHPEEAVVLEGTVEVLPFDAVTAEIIPRTSSGPRGGRHRLAVDNRGNRATLVELSGDDQRDLLGFRFGAPELTVEPGTVQFTDFTVRPHKTIWRGSTLTHPFFVSVAPIQDWLAGTEELTTSADPGKQQERVVLDGTHLQQPVLPPWLLKALLALLLLAAALVALWFLLIRPAVVSAATGAVQEAVEEATDDTAEAATEAGSAAGSAEEAAVAADAAADKAEEIVNRMPAPVTTTPIARRLVVDAAVRRTDTAVFVFDDPATTLNLTDVVMSNPQGDFGRLRLELGDTILLDLALENFRDTDYHFLTPIQVSSDQELRLTLTCNRVGGAVDVATAPTTCNDSALLGGTLSKPQ